MDKKHARFLNLERSRKEAPPEAARLRDSSRFGAVEAPPEAPLAESQRSGANVGRFEEPELQLALDEKRDGNQPFSQCVQCLADSPPFAARCIRCGASFDTPEQRLYNEALWKERQQAREDEMSALQSLRANRIEAEAAAAKQKQELAVALAREAKESAMARLNLEPGWSSTTPLLVRLLRRVPNPLARFGIAALVLLGPVLAIAATRRTSSLRVVAVLSLVVSPTLVIPPRWLSHRRHRWWD